MVVKIFVGNLQVESNRETEAALRKLFEQYGTVTECDILTRKNFGFVHMEDEKEADIAIASLHGEEFFGGQINVERSDNQSRGKKPPRGGGSGFGGGRGRGGGGRGGGRFDRNDYGGGGRGRGGYGGDRRSSRYDPYGRERDPYGSDPYSRDPYARDPYARSAYARDPYARSAYGRPPMPESDDVYSRPPPEYYGRSAGIPSRDPYYDRYLAASASLDRELVSYPLPRSSSYGKSAPV